MSGTINHPLQAEFTQVIALQIFSKIVYECMTEVKHLPPKIIELLEDDLCLYLIEVREKTITKVYEFLDLFSCKMIAVAWKVKNQRISLTTLPQNGIGILFASDIFGIQTDLIFTSFLKFSPLGENFKKEVKITVHSTCFTLS